MKDMKMWSAVAAALALPLVLSACGGGSTSSEASAPPSTAPAADAGSPAASAAASTGDSGVARAMARLDEYRGVPAFQEPGPAFDAMAASGKTIAYIPLTSEIPYLTYVQDALTEAMDQVGVKVIGNTNQGQPDQWAQAINQAISQKVDAIVLYDVPDALVAPQLEAAKEAGIPVIQKHNADPSELRFTEDMAVVSSNLPAPWLKTGELIGSQAIVDTDGAADAIIVTSGDHEGAGTIVKGIESTFKADCPDCKITIVDVALADWSSKIQPELQTALVKNPNANYVLPVFDGMMQFVKPAITSAGAGRDIGIATYNATPFVMDEMRDGNLVRMNLGESYRQIGWGVADAALRLMSGQPAINDDLIPLRVFTKENVEEVGVPAGVETGYGDAFITGYKSLWGVS